MLFFLSSFDFEVPVVAISHPALFIIRFYGGNDQSGRKGDGGRKDVWRERKKFTFAVNLHGEETSICVIYDQYFKLQDGRTMAVLHFWRGSPDNGKKDDDEREIY